MSGQALRRVEVFATTHAALVLAAEASGRSIPEIVDDLVMRREESAYRRNSAEAITRSSDSGSTTDRIPIHKVYKRHRFDGTYDKSTQVVTITSAPFNGEVFNTPTAAAVAVVTQVSPDRVYPETNGYLFWKLANGHPLNEIRTA